MGRPSLTMPLKRTVLPLLDHVDPMAAATGGVNTVVFRADDATATTSTSRASSTR